MEGNAQTMRQLGEDNDKVEAKLKKLEEEKVAWEAKQKSISEENTKMYFYFYE